jgi:hypothetical protein
MTQSTAPPTALAATLGTVALQMAELAALGTVATT